MTKSERLFRLTSLLLRSQFAVTAGALARRFGVSVRTVYRDIASLQSQGVPIEGEAGVGYVLRECYKLPAIGFSPGELEALVLGLRWVIGNADSTLVLSAKESIVKLAAAVDSSINELANAAPAVVENRRADGRDDDLVIALRRSIEHHRKVAVTYRDVHETTTERIVWPVVIGYFNSVRLMAGWCELRSDFRCFRCDRIVTLSESDREVPVSTLQLHARWQARADVPPINLSV